MAEMEKPVVVITGAAGMVGQALIERLEQRYTVVGFDLPDLVQDRGDAMIGCDVTSDQSVDLAMRKLSERFGRHVTSVIHLAAYFDFSGQEKPPYRLVNEEGTRRLLQALQAFEVDQFVYSGTMLVHEPADPGERIDESTPLDPSWAYPESKLRTEQIIREAAGDIPVVLLRLAGLYDAQTAVPTLSHQIARIYERGVKSRFYSGDPATGQALLHMQDMLALFEAVVGHRDRLESPCALLAGEADVMSYAALQDRIGELIHGKSWSTLQVPKPVARAGAALEVAAEPMIPDAYDEGEKPFIRPFMIDMADDHYALDIRTPRELLGWEPKHRLRDVLPDMIATLKEDPRGWYRANGIKPPPWMVAADDRDENPDALYMRYEEQYRAQHAQGVWAHWTNAGLGLWLMALPLFLGPVGPWMLASHLGAGLAVLLLSFLSMSWRLAKLRWITAAVGVWMMFAPLLFWSPAPGLYTAGTLIGLLIAGFAVVVRPPPPISPVAALTGPSVPKGWDYSPSEWTQRIPVIALAMVGLIISVYLGSYQVEVIGAVWEPFFGGAPGDGKNGTEEIITSSVSEAWPVPDAGVGGLTYALEILVGAMGSARRWRTMPWLVVLFGIMIVPLGAVSIFFIVIQPILIGTYCTLCLIAAAAMLFQIPYSLDELVATGQFLRRRHKAGQPWLRVFFTGDTDEGPDDFAEVDFERPARAIVRDMVTGGMEFTWTLWASICVGVLLMLSPLILTWDSPVAASVHICGALAITVSVAASASIARAARFLNALIGVVLIFAPFVAAGGWGATAFCILAGLGLIALSIPRGPVKESFGSWDRYIR